MLNSKKIIFDKKNVLVTGGAGFIGSHLCDELVKNNKVICLDNFSTGYERNIDHLLANPNFRFIKHDISQPADLETFSELADFKIEFQGLQEIYHLACPTSPRFFEQNRLGNILANSFGVKNSLDLAVKYQCKFLHFSSSVVYGEPRADRGKINEDDFGRVNNLSDRSSYDEGKRFAETIVKTYRDVYGLDGKILRAFRVYGSRMPLDEGYMLPDFISSALDDKDLVIYGDATFASSLCYISDCLSAVEKLMASDLAGPINVGSDIDLNLTAIAQKIIKLLDSKSKIRYENEMLFMSALNLPDLTRARDLLGWFPLVSIDQGLEKTIASLRAAKGLKQVDFKQF